MRTASPSTTAAGPTEGRFDLAYEDQDRRSERYGGGGHESSRP